MFCMHCGHELPNGAKFCINCGSPKGQMSPSVITTSNTLNSGKINSSTSANLPKIGDVLYFGNDCGSKICWTVLKQHENQDLIITSDTIHSLPYHRLGSAVMWKECSLRKWLNNTFYNECFSEEERARVPSKDNFSLRLSR